jgi:hypothetical protein
MNSFVWLSIRLLVDSFETSGTTAVPASIVPALYVAACSQVLAACGAPAGQPANVYTSVPGEHAPSLEQYVLPMIVLDIARLI